MTDIDTPTTDPHRDPHQDSPVESPADLRRAAREGQRAKAELQTLQRELALRKAGVDFDHPIGRMFGKVYEGDLDVEVVKAEWATVAPLPPAPVEYVPAGPVFTPDEMSSTAMRSALANNAPADFVRDPDPRLEAEKVAEAVRRGGGTTEEAMAVMFDHLAGAAVKGDGRVIVP